MPDPRLASYYSPTPGWGHTVLAPTQFGRAFNGFALDASSFHPWFLATLLYRKGDESEIANTLSAYYSLVQPKSLHDWLDIPENTCLGLADLPVYAWMMLPWSARTPQDLIKGVVDAQLNENRRYGLNEGMTAGAKAFGPVTEGKLRVEVGRLTTLAASIKRHGFLYDKAEPLKATFLVSGGEWRWLAVNAMHRVPVAAAFDVDQMAVQVSTVVRRDEADIWPQVVSGLYDRDTALNLFDRLFEGRAPKCATEWIQWVESLRSIPASP